jgi:prepilin-type N-terminal cleavage/methylation domain-containing protein
MENRVVTVITKILQMSRNRVCFSREAGLMRTHKSLTARRRLCTLNTYSFTLVEVLVVIALIAIVAGVGAGLYKGTYEGLVVKRAARDFYLAAKYARMLAIERQRPCRLILDNEENRYAIVIDELSEDSGEIEQRAVRDFYFRPVQLAGDIKFEDINITSTDADEDYGEQGRTIVFSPDGTSQAAVIQIGDGKTHYTASVSPATGRVRMEFGQADDVGAQIVDLDRMEQY